MSRKIKLGWIPDLPDHRDQYFTSRLSADVLPTAVDLRAQCPAVYDQGSLGSCTAQSMAGALHFTTLEAKKTPFIPSRLYIYYNTRVLQGTVNQDSGASLRTTVKSVVNQGFGPEPLWPYKVSQFKVKPAKSVYTDAETRKLTTLCYERVDNRNLNLLKAAISQNNPMIFGFSVYESFMSSTVARSGMVTLPKTRERMQGGHAMLVVGYSDARQWFIVRNSWGAGWGDKGYCYMPYSFLTNDDLANDFWIIKAVP